MRLRAGDEVIAVNIAQDDADLLVVTENGYGKRTRVSEYPVKGRGGLGVKTVQLTEAKGQLAGARVVRDGYQVMLISDGGTVIRMPADDIKRSGRSTQGVIVMRLREGEQVSTPRAGRRVGRRQDRERRTTEPSADAESRAPDTRPKGGDLQNPVPTRERGGISLKRGVPAVEGRRVRHGSQ